MRDYLNTAAAAVALDCLAAGPLVAVVGGYVPAGEPRVLIRAPTVHALIRHGAARAKGGRVYQQKEKRA